MADSRQNDRGLLEIYELVDSRPALRHRLDEAPVDMQHDDPRTVCRQRLVESRGEIVGRRDLLRLDAEALGV